MRRFLLLAVVLALNSCGRQPTAPVNHVCHFEKAVVTVNGIPLDTVIIKVCPAGGAD